MAIAAVEVMQMNIDGNLAIDERIPSHVFRYVERELYDYKVNRALCLECLRHRNDELLRVRQRPEDDRTRAEGVVCDQVGAKVLRLLALEQRAERALFYVRAIESVLGALSDEERKLVERKYFDGDITNDALAAELSMGRSRFYEVRAAVIRKFALRLGLL